MGAELAGERSQALIADFEAYFGHGALGGEQLPGAIQAQAGEKIMWSFAERGSEEAMEMKFGKTGFARRLPQQNVGVASRREKITSAAQAAESVIMEKLRHEEMILWRALWG
jgi:hypothetical protein